jgi:hypothetical protein
MNASLPAPDASPLGAGILMGSAWAALCCYAWSTGRLAWGPPQSPAARWIWTLGCASFAVHVAAAFEVFYGWSQEQAWEDIAAQSESLSGVRAPWGLWLNYGFGMVWLGETAWWWRVGDASHRRRSRSWNVALHGVFLFMLLNGGFVFVERWTRWIGLGLFLVSAAAAGSLLRRSRAPAAEAAGSRHAAPTPGTDDPG